MTAIVQGMSFNRLFILVQSSDHISPLLGANPLVVLSKAGAPFVQTSAAPAEVGNGWYSIELGPTDTNIIGELAYHVTALNADNSDFADQIVPSSPGPSPIPPPGIAPTLSGFLEFITNVMGIPTTVLPRTSPVIGMAFAVALSIVNPALRIVKIPQQDAVGVSLNSGGQSIYSIAVYNLAASNLLSFAPDQSGFTYFADLRTKNNINSFVSGVIQSTGDESTNASFVVQEAAKQFTLANLQDLKNPYGRTYLALAQSYGPTTFGLS